MLSCESHFVLFKSLVEYFQCLPLYVASSNCLLSNQLGYNVQEGLRRQQRNHLSRWCGEGGELNIIEL